MICPRCLLRASRSSSQAVISAPTLSRSRLGLPKTITSAATPPPSQSNSGASTPPTAQPSHPADAPPPPPPTPAPKKAPSTPSIHTRSSVKEGTQLRGLNYLKNGSDPVAMRDDEYPPWLWTILEPKKKKDGALEADESSLSRKEKKKLLRKKARSNAAAAEPEIPLYEQTIDLPAGDGTLEGAVAAQTARGALTKAMRTNRRTKIKEANFLKTM